MLDLSSFKNAINSFERTLNVACSDKKMQDLDDDQKDAIRAGVIQNFEFTYELCWKFMKRWLDNNLGSSHVDGVARRELFRLGVEHRLINDVDAWMIYHDARNETSHTYNDKKAEEVFEIAKKFFPDAKSFLANLEKVND
ncbi:MAG: nucleotidyltransferase substrate binding protein [Candidatus Omnitrophica bacterium]|nr:nucleotidyltransferase substrate binding protein [Candidatus Omnitrophota bacterium]